MQTDQAETVALQALAWLAANEELLPVFLGSTGAALNDLSKVAGDSAVLGSVLDFLLLDDAWILAFCESAGVQPTDIATARRALPGGEAVHWT